MLLKSHPSYSYQISSGLRCHLNSFDLYQDLLLTTCGKRHNSLNKNVLGEFSHCSAPTDSQQVVVGFLVLTPGYIALLLTESSQCF